MSESDQGVYRASQQSAPGCGVPTVLLSYSCILAYDSLSHTHTHTNIYIYLLLINFHLLFIFLISEQRRVSCPWIWVLSVICTSSTVTLLRSLRRSTDTHTNTEKSPWQCLQRPLHLNLVSDLHPQSRCVRPSGRVTS